MESRIDDRSPLSRIEPRRPAAADQQGAVGGLLQRQPLAGGIDQMLDDRRDRRGDVDLDREALRSRRSMPSMAATSPPLGAARNSPRGARGSARCWSSARSRPPSARSAGSSVSRRKTRAVLLRRAWRRRRWPSADWPCLRSGRSSRRPPGARHRAPCVRSSVARQGWISSPWARSQRHAPLDVAHLLRPVGDQDAAADAHFQIGVELGLQSAPQLDGRDQHLDHRREVARPGVALLRGTVDAGSGRGSCRRWRRRPAC